MTDRLDAHPDTGPGTPAAEGARLRDALRSIGLGAGLDAVGVAGAEAFPDVARTLEQRRAAGLHGGMQFTYRNPARSTDPQRILSGARSLVVGARRYLRQPPDDPLPAARPDSATAPATARPAAAGTASDAGRIARYSWVDHYAPLREALAAMARHLQAAGWRAVVVADDNALVDRAAAHRAGLGWYGKNTTLLLPGAGSWFLLGSVVTDAPLPVAGEPVADGCGTCRRCQAACPTGALDTAGVLDARRCLAWLVQAPGAFPVDHRVALGDRFYGCDDCQEACPVNRLGARRHPPAPAEPDARPGADLLAVLGATDEELLTQWGRWYIPGRDPAVLRRNALLVLANIADPADPAVAGALEAALRHRSPLVRAHAVWAARRLGRPDLLGLVGNDPDPSVRAEADPSLVVPRRDGPDGPDGPVRRVPPPT